LTPKTRRKRKRRNKRHKKNKKKNKAKMKNNIALIGCLLGFVLLFAACSGNTVYERYQSIPQDTWDMNDSMHFEVNMEDTVGHYQVLLLIKHTHDYPYQNLWLFTQSMAPDSTLATDTLECFLADNSGKWLSQSFISEREMPLIYMQRIRFPKSGTYTFDITHGMRDSLLRGVSRIGLSIELINSSTNVQE
jgi:gliding motility-associated lipoprotein GldH